MSSKRKAACLQSPRKRKSINNPSNYLLNCLRNCGLIINEAPGKHIATTESVYIVKDLKSKVQDHFNYPDNVNDLYTCIENECNDLESFKHFLYPNIVRSGLKEDSEDQPLNDSVIRILLHVPALQEKLTDYVFNKAIDLAIECKCQPWIKAILICFTGLDNINMNVLSKNFINLLEVASEHLVRLEIITAIPDILGDQEHETIASEMTRFLNDDCDLIPAVLECLSSLCLSDDQNIHVQNKILNILMTSTDYAYYPSFIKFLLMPGRADEPGYMNIIKGLRENIDWPTSSTDMQQIDKSQLSTSIAIRNSMISSKTIAHAWMRVLSLCELATEHKPLDMIILLLIYTISEEKQKIVEKLVKNEIKLDILKKDFIKESFIKFKPVFKKYLSKLCELINSILISQTDPLVANFASHVYILMYTELDDSRMIVSQLLQLGLNRKQHIASILWILNKIGERDMSMLKPQSTKLLTLLDTLEDLNLNEKRDIMNLVCGLAYSSYNSTIRNDFHIMMVKQLGSSSCVIKIQGILAGVYAVKYLTRSDDTSHVNEKISNSRSEHYLLEGELKEAKDIIELIAHSTRQFTDLIVFYYDELCSVITSAQYINPNFMAWLKDTVTDDLKTKFFVKKVVKDTIGQLRISLQYNLSTTGDALNIAGLVLEPNDDVEIGILPSLLKLVQTLHSKQNNGDFSSIDRLLRCPVIMPTFDLDLIDDLELEDVHQILNCLIHCVNWFRELINGFASVSDGAPRKAILKRIIQIENLELLIAQILIKTNGSYKPPNCCFDIEKYNRDSSDKYRVPVLKSSKKSADETCKSQTNSYKGDIAHKIHYRDLTLSIVNLLNNDICTTTDAHATVLNVKVLKFLLNNINNQLEKSLFVNTKRKTFFTKPQAIYDHEKAEASATAIDGIMSNLMDYLKYLCDYLEKLNDDMECDTSCPEYNDYLLCLESSYVLMTTYMKWVGFRKHNKALLKASLTTIANVDKNKPHLLKDLFILVADLFQDHEKYCVQISTAVSLFDLLNAIQELSGNITLHEALKKLSYKFLTKQWKTSDGVLEKGFYFNHSVEKITSLYFINSDIIDLKQLTERLKEETRHLKGKYDALTSMKCFNIGNFPILYRNIGTAIHNAVKNKINSDATHSEQLNTWMHTVVVLNDMIEICKIVDNRNNLSAIFKKSLPILTLFKARGIPVLNALFKKDTDHILTMFENLRKTTRFLQSLCCHTRLKKDTTLMKKVPLMKHTLETLIYSVKALLAKHNCSQAFSMGNLPNKDIYGEIISSQKSISEDLTEDTDDNLPSDDDEQLPDDTDPDSKSSDII